MAFNAPTPTLSPATSLLHPGLLENAPDAWLQLLFSRLASKDKLAAFKVGRRTARLVVRHCPSFRLVLTGYRATNAMGTSEQAITRLLIGLKQQLTVQVNLPYGPQPFPYELSPDIHKLFLEEPSRPAANSALETPWLQFDRLTGLKALCLKYAVSECVLISLCTALEAGHMPHLHHFEYDNCTRSWPKQRSEAIHRRLASALGASVTMLHAAAPSHDGILLNYLHLFCKLETLELSKWCWISKRVMKQLCEHPSLLTVILDSCMQCENYSILKCKSWKTLISKDHAHNLHKLLSFPLEALQEVVLQRNALVFSQESTAVLTQLLRLGSKLVWTPVWPSSGQALIILSAADEPMKLCTTVMPLLRCLRSPSQQTIGLHYYGLDNMQAVELFPTLWQHMPACVTDLVVDIAAVYDGVAVWEGMPVLVANVTLRKLHCGSTTCSNTLHLLVRTVPAHVRSLKLVFARGQTLLTDYASLQAIAPPHVKLSVSMS